MHNLFFLCGSDASSSYRQKMIFTINTRLYSGLNNVRTQELLEYNDKAATPISNFLE